MKTSTPNTNPTVTISSQQFRTLMERNKTISLIDHNKMQFLNNKLLDKENKKITIFPQWNTKQDSHHQILNDICEKNVDFQRFEIIIFFSKIMRKRKYYIILLPSNIQIVKEILFATIYRKKDVECPQELYCIENNIDFGVF